MMNRTAAVTKYDMFLFVVSALVICLTLFNVMMGKPQATSVAFWNALVAISLTFGVGTLFVAIKSSRKTIADAQRPADPNY